MMDGYFIGNIDLILLPVKNVFKLMNGLPVKTVILFAPINEKTNKVSSKVIHFQAFLHN